MSSIRQQYNKSDISYQKRNSCAFEHSNPLKSSSSCHSQSVSGSVGITSSCSLLAFPLSVSLVSLCLYVVPASWYLPQTRNCASSTHSSYTKQSSEFPKSTKV